MHFTLISHKFNELISRVSRGEPIDEDDIGIMNFQVELWKTRTIESRNNTHPIEWEATSLPKLPSSMTIVYLRANAINGIFLRPFFLYQTNGERAVEKIKPGLELVTDLSVSFLFSIALAMCTRNSCPISSTSWCPLARCYFLLRYTQRSITLHFHHSSRKHTHGWCNRILNQPSNYQRHTASYLQHRVGSGNSCKSLAAP